MPSFRAIQIKNFTQRHLEKHLLIQTLVGMATNSSAATRKRAKDLAQKIGSYHCDFDIDTVVTAITTLFTAVTRFTPRYKMYGGTSATNLALQNIQARTVRCFPLLACPYLES